jgi:hypothetical protein
MLTVLKTEPVLPPNDKNPHLHLLRLRLLQQIDLKMTPTVTPTWEIPEKTVRLRKTTPALEWTIWR